MSNWLKWMTADDFHGAATPKPLKHFNGIQTGLATDYAGAVGHVGVPISLLKAVAVKFALFSCGYILIAGIWLSLGLFFSSVSYCAVECIKKDN